MFEIYLKEVLKSTLDFESYVHYGKQNLVIFKKEYNITIPSHVHYP